MKLEGDNTTAFLVGPGTSFAGFTIVASFLHSSAILTRLVCLHSRESFLPESFILLQLLEFFLLLFLEELLVIVLGCFLLHRHRLLFSLDENLLKVVTCCCCSILGSRGGLRKTVADDVSVSFMFSFIPPPAPSAEGGRQGGPSPCAHFTQFPVCSLLNHIVGYHSFSCASRFPRYTTIKRNTDKGEN